MFLVMAHMDVADFECLDEYDFPQWSTQGSWWPVGCMHNGISPEPRDEFGWEEWGFGGFPEHGGVTVHA